MSSQEITFGREDVANGDIGSLYLFVKWRAKRALVPKDFRRDWRESELLLPVEAAAVVPRSVLFWDYEPERPNSLKRFAYMLGLRATPLALVKDGSPEALLSLLEVEEHSADVGYTESRLQAREMLAHHLASRAEAGFARRENTRLRFNYQPPLDKASISELHAYISSQAEEA